MFLCLVVVDTTGGKTEALLAGYRHPGKGESTLESWNLNSHYTIWHVNNHIQLRRVIKKKQITNLLNDLFLFQQLRSLSLHATNDVKLTRKWFTRIKRLWFCRRMKTYELRRLHWIAVHQAVHVVINREVKFLRPTRAHPCNYSR